MSIEWTEVDCDFRSAKEIQPRNARTTIALDGFVIWRSELQIAFDSLLIHIHIYEYEKRMLRTQKMLVSSEKALLAVVRLLTLDCYSQNLNRLSFHCDLYRGTFLLSLAGMGFFWRVQFADSNSWKRIFPAKALPFCQFQSEYEREDRLENRILRNVQMPNCSVLV